MKKRRTLSLLMAGILTASALAIGASAEDTEPAPQAGIEQEETVSEKKAKKSAESTSEESKSVMDSGLFRTYRYREDYNTTVKYI